jgi:plastocyanin
LLATGAIAALALGVGACGGDGGGSNEPKPGRTVDAVGGKVEVAAKGIKFDVATITAKPGPLTVTFTNNDAVGHDFSVHDLDGSATPDLNGGTASVTYELEAGTYDFFCSLFGHEAQGMKGTIVVE